MRSEPGIHTRGADAPHAARSPSAAAVPAALPASTCCCVVGASPAGAVLALLLARRGVDVTLLEAHRDLDRDFRGDTLQPAVLEALDELGLIDRVLALPHVKVERFVVQAGPDRAVFAEFRGLRTRFPYVLTVPQARLLELLVEEAARCESFRLELGARVEGLVEEGGAVQGVRYRGLAGERELRATLTVGADGRHSKVRRLAGLEDDRPRTADAMDVLWLRLPREPGDPPRAGATFRFGDGGLLVLMDHVDAWQVGLILEKGGFPRLRAAGLEGLRATLATLAPELANRAESLVDWRQTSLLSVESSCLPRWHRPGVLLIGDAAHVVSPVGGVGINLAVQDALAAARHLAGPLRVGSVRPSDLEAVQRERLRPTRTVQACQDWAQRWVVRRALGLGAPSRLPAWVRLALRVPALRRVPGGLIAFAARPTAAGRGAAL